MGLVMVVDTNVFLLAHDDVACGMVVNYACYARDVILALDRDNEIRNEYVRLASSHPESRLREFVQRMIDQQGSDALFKTLCQRSQLSESDLEFLRRKQCHNPIEPQMLGIARKGEHTYLVVPDEKLLASEVVKRGYRAPTILDEIKTYFSDVKLQTTHSLEWLTEPGDPAQRDYSSLESFLEHHRLDKYSAEREFLELKCPESTEVGLMSRSAKDIMEAVCAMTNMVDALGGGYIFVGVENNGTIHGVPLLYNEEPCGSWDELWLTIASSEFSYFKPRKPLLRQWFIPVSDDRSVIAIRVSAQRGPEYSYRGQVYVREGTMSVRRDAVQRR